MAEIERKTDKANGIVKKYMLGSLAVGIVPIPLMDMAILSGLQLKMLHSLARLYEVAFSETLGKSLIASLLGGGISASVSSSFAGLFKVVPFIGQSAHLVSTSLFSGASTYAIGKVFIQHFESGGTFLTFDPQRVRHYYARQFEKGKEEVMRFAGVKP